MLRHLGFVANCLEIGRSTSRTCRLKNATIDRLRELVASNLDDLEAVVEHCGTRGIRLYRISSEVVPFGSHPVNQLAWWDEFAEPLARIGRRVAELGIRVSMHPGQFTVLNSQRAATVAASIAELAWHSRFLDALGTGPSSKIVLHVGGGFGEKPAAMARFASVAADLPDAVRRRLVIENDERVYGVSEVLEVSAATGLPMIYDNLHDAIHRGGRSDPGGCLADVFATWKPADGPPKVHISTQAPGGRPGHHADLIDPADLIRVAEAAPADRPFDAMIEAKRKDQALHQLREQAARLGLVETPGPIPPASKPTGSRKRARGTGSAEG